MECPAMRGPGGLVECAGCRCRFIPDDPARATIISAATPSLPERFEDVPLSPEFQERYRLRQVLGTGAMGTVYMADRSGEAAPVAMKFLTRSGDADALARFVREGRLLVSIRHPNVVVVMEVGEQSGHPYMVCEHLGGGTLRDRLAAQGRLASDEACPLMLDMLAGLQECHERGIVHRDVKPANILLSISGRAKIADLGIAKVWGSVDQTLTQTGSIIGTPQYMSPEQVRGEPLTLASDLYSLGVILYEMLSGQPPFRAVSPFQVMQMHQEVAPRPLREVAPDVPEGVAALVGRAISKQPGSRPASALDFATMLRRHASPARSPRTDGGVRGRPPARDPNMDGARAAGAQPSRGSTGATPRPVWLAFGLGLLVILVGEWISRRWDVSLALPASGPAAPPGASAAVPSAEGPGAASRSPGAEDTPAPPAAVTASARAREVVARANELAGRRLYGRAAVQYRSAIALVPDSMEPRLGLAACLARMGRVQEAEDTLRAALQTERTAFDVRLDLAWLLGAKGQVWDGAALLQEAIALWPDRKDAASISPSTATRSGSISIWTADSRSARVRTSPRPGPENRRSGRASRRGRSSPTGRRCRRPDRPTRPFPATESRRGRR
jgi:serine/threonine protein kinase